MCSPTGILHLKPIKPMCTCRPLRIHQAEVATESHFRVLLNHIFKSCHRVRPEADI